MKKNISDVILENNVIAVDCDEVLCDSTRYFFSRTVLEKEDGTRLLLSDLKDYRFYNNIGVIQTKEEFTKLLNDMYVEDKGLYKVPPLSGAFEYMKYLKSLGKELHLVTARQEFLREYTKSWIHVYFPDIFSEFHFCNHEGGGIYRKKSEICQQIGTKLLFDDSPYNALDCAENGITTILLQMPWNEGVNLKNNSIYRVKNFVDLKNQTC